MKAIIGGDRYNIILGKTISECDCITIMFDKFYCNRNDEFNSRVGSGVIYQTSWEQNTLMQ